jgi:hypothetical protein
MGFGSGRGYRASLRDSGVVISVSNDTVSYPPPTLNPVSLRQNRTNYDSTPAAVVQLDTSLPVLLQFSGTNFDPAVTIITYGPAPTGLGATCEVVVAQSTESLITCRTAADSQGANLVFRVDVAGQVVVSTFAVSFPLTPTVVSVSGCVPAGTCLRCMLCVVFDVLTHFVMCLFISAGNKTIGCPTEGGIRITITGTSFAQNGLAVSVAGAPCTDASVGGGITNGTGTIVECTLPVSTGGSNVAVVVKSSGQNSQPARLLSYGINSITRVLFGFSHVCDALRARLALNCACVLLIRSGSNCPKHNGLHGHRQPTSDGQLSHHWQCDHHSPGH